MGATYKEIAIQLGVTSKTARSHLSNLYRQLDVHNRAEAVICALQLGLVDLYSQNGNPSVEANASSTLARPDPTIVLLKRPVGHRSTGGVNGRPS